MYYVQCLEACLLIGPFLKLELENTTLKKWKKEFEYTQFFSSLNMSTPCIIFGIQAADEKASAADEAPRRRRHPVGEKSGNHLPRQVQAAPPTMKNQRKLLHLGELINTCFLIITIEIRDSMLAKFSLCQPFQVVVPLAKTTPQRRVNTMLLPNFLAANCVFVAAGISKLFIFRDVER